jgi:predicted glycoside hydrolase/deacetylase ChbG (UPF0249 family)
MQVIVNADDFGFDADTVSTTIALLGRGVVTSATIIGNMPGSADALRYAASERRRGFGAHLAFAGGEGERPVGSPSDCDSLMGADGYLASSTTVRLRAVAGLIRASDVESEAVAQLSLIADHGVALSHVDTHHHLHNYEPFRSVLQRVLPRFGMMRLRSAQDVRALIRPWRPVWWTGRRVAGAIRSSFRTTDHFVMLDQGRPSSWWERCETMFSEGGTLEFGCHPGTSEAWRRLEHDSAVEFADWCDRRGISRIDWRSIAD